MGIPRRQGGGTRIPNSTRLMGHAALAPYTQTHCSRDGHGEEAYEFGSASTLLLFGYKQIVSLRSLYLSIVMFALYTVLYAFKYLLISRACVHIYIYIYNVYLAL